ncbi:MAG TPA: TonB-dependent receptor plug domain-containing protein [Polyangiaceae bacterium]|nr:TonB-dependent receptor plug domain-containing protein [Polyangiaceae bacterium]
MIGLCVSLRDIETTRAEEGVEPLAEVVVQAESAGQRLRESAQAVKVVEAREARRHTADAGDVLARTEGVAVQRSGGLGSESRLSLHGLTGDQIRVFLDGVPLEFSGFGLGVSTVPMNWVERFEIYRGVVPIRLGTDALGGAIDVVTDPSARGTGVVGSYTTGAFDTHQLALNARTRDDASGFLARVSGYYDTSDNDYLVDVRVPNDVGRLEPARVRRFHDGYRAGGGRVELGLIDRAWTRSLLLEGFATSFTKELQHNVNMSVPYGEASNGQTVVGGTLRYQSPHLPSAPFDVSALFGYSHRRLDFRDTSRWVYDWFGNRVFERSPGSGETSTLASDRTQWEHRALARLTLTRPLDELQRMQLVLAPDFTTRTGTERLRVNPDRLDPLTTERDVLQLVSGLEHALRDLDDVVENVAFVKYYMYRPATDQVEVFDDTIRHIEDTTHRAGFGDAFRVWFLPGLLGKLSYEYATRLPRPDEVFGDGALVLPNLELGAETGHNANIGAQLDTLPSTGFGSLSFEASGFLRHTERMVVRLLAEDRVHSIHQNVGTARTLGVDGVARWSSPRRLLTLQLNGTWQDQRNRSDRGAFTAFDGQRIPNRPWLFANGSASLAVPGFGAANGELSLSWITRYVHDFRAGWEQGAGDVTNRIPSQLTHSVGAMYSVAGPLALDFAFDLSNVTNERVFDVLGVQRPGRAAYVEITIGWDEREGAEPSLVATETN